MGMRRAQPQEPICAPKEAATAMPPPGAVRMQLERLRSHAFAGSGKLFAFLVFVVNEALEGRAGSLKEVVIGIELYGSATDYDPRIDSTVRVEARRLRRKLDAYYAGPGCDDPLVISIPTGGYAPQFRVRDTGSASFAAPPLLAPERPLLAVLPFTALCENQIAFAAGVTDELVCAALQDTRLRVAPRAITFQFREGRYSLADLAAHSGSDVVLHGTVRQADAIRRVSVEMYSSLGVMLWSDRIDVDAAEDFGSQERIAADIVARLPRTCFPALAGPQ